MTDLKSVITKALTDQGIYSVLDIRPGVIQDFKKKLFFIWLIINLPTLRIPILFWLWVISIFLALTIEQSIFTWGLLKRRQINSFSDILRTIVSRKMNQRLNIWTVGIYLLLRYSTQFFLLEHDLVIIDHLFSLSQLLDLTYILIVANPILLLPGIKTTALLETGIVGIKLIYIRTLRNIRIVLSSSLRFSIPAVVLISVLGIISSEIWRFYSLLSWNQLVLAIIVFLFPIMFASQKRLASRIEKYVADEIEGFDPCSLDNLRRSIRVVSGADYFDLAESEYTKYQKNLEWKWKENILYRASRRLTHDLKVIAIGIYRLTLLAFIPGFFIFVLLSAVILFSKEFLISFVPVQSYTNILSYSETQTIWIWAENVLSNILFVPQDVLFKYAAISTFFLVGQFIITYPENKDVFEEMGFTKSNISDWLYLIFAYELICEEGYFNVSMPAESANQYDPYYFLSIFVVPNDTDKRHFTSIAKGLVKKELSLYTDGSRASLILMNSASLTQTKLYKDFNAFYRFRNIPVTQATSADTSTLVYLGKQFDSNSGAHFFDTFEDAKTWVVQIVIPPKYRS